MAGLRVNAVTAPFVIDQAMTGEIFRAYVKRCRVPTLSPGEIVIPATLSSWTICRLIKSPGARCDRGDRRHVALPAAVLARLQPDRDAVCQTEGAVAPRRRAHHPITVGRLGRRLDDFSADECSRYLAYAGYGSI